MPKRKRLERLTMHPKAGGAMLMWMDALTSGALDLNAEELKFLFNETRVALMRLGKPDPITTSGADILLTENDQLRDILCSLNLYIGQYEWTQLTTEQKNMLADVVDRERQQNFPDDHTPLERWWQ